MLITDPVFYAIAVPVVLLTGISKTGVPGLFGGMAVPLFSLVMPPAQAAALMLPILCFIDLFGLRAFKGIYDRRNMPILLTASRSASSVECWSSRRCRATGRGCSSASSQRHLR
jgi:uncharacterized membrane protein YfcA